MAYWEPITYKDLIILTEWMAQQGYSARPARGSRA